MQNQSTFEIFFSNRIELLSRHLQNNLFINPDPFQKKIIIVPNHAMKSWLKLEMAKESGIAAGVDYCTMDEMWHCLIAHLSIPHEYHTPSHLELALAIELEIKNSFIQFKEFSENEKSIWKPMLLYLGCSPEEPGNLGFKGEKRLIQLADQLARLFKLYGIYGGKMADEWTTGKLLHWQQQLWINVFTAKRGIYEQWKTPTQLLSLLNSTLKSDEALEVHFFSTSYLSTYHFSLLHTLSAAFPVKGYLLSPCQVFWSDTLTDKERLSLFKHLKKKKISEAQETALEEILRENNPLLVNFGRLGREMIEKVEAEDISAFALYILPESIQKLEFYDSLVYEEMLLEHQGPLTMLQAIQSDMVLMRTSDLNNKLSFFKEDRSIQIHISSSKWREIENLYETLTDLLHHHSSDSIPIYPHDILVMAPNISEYAPFIKTIFGAKESTLSIQMMDLKSTLQDAGVQVFFYLIELAMSRWDVVSFMQLFESPFFLNKHQFNFEDVKSIRKWIEESEVRWGVDPSHRNALLKKDHCLEEMVENSSVGTWEECFKRLLLGISMIVDSDQREHEHLFHLPLESIEISKCELIGKWIYLMRSLKNDLNKISNRQSDTWENWIRYLIFLIDKYILGNEEKDEGELLLEKLEGFLKDGALFKDQLFSYETIHHQLKAVFNQCTLNHHEAYLEAVRFCSMLPMRAIPAKVIVLIGMEEGVFPKSEPDFSLNLMKGNAQVDYFPTQTDYDRYLFLEIILSARQYLIFSYRGISEKDGKELLPSLVISELQSYLDLNYEIEGNKVSEHCIRRHPFSSFDQRYFSGDKKFPCGTRARFLGSQAFYHPKKEPSHQFLSTFCIQPNSKTILQDRNISLKQLSAFARNPLKMYFNDTLGIYLREEDEKKIDEKFVLSPLDVYQLKNATLRKTPDAVLNVAEKQGKLPLGLFKEIASSKIHQEASQLYQNLNALGVDLNKIFQIECADYCQIPNLSDGYWIVPPLEIKTSHGLIKIVGKFLEVATQGLIVHVKDSQADILKVWPLFLVFDALVKKYHLPVECQLLFAKSGTKKTPYYDDPIPLLGNYLEYYDKSKENASPLIPEWTQEVITLDVQGVDQHLSASLNNSFKPLYNDYVQWISRGGSFPLSSTWLCDWKTLAENNFGEMYRMWYPPKTSKTLSASDE